MKKVKFLALAMLAAVLVLLTPKTAMAKFTSQRSSWEKYMIKTGISYKDKTLQFLENDYYFSESVASFAGVKDFQITSSDPTICTVEERDQKYSTGPSFILKHHKPGKAALICTFKYRGKTYKSRARIKVVPYTNPLKSLKAGGKEYKQIFDENVAYPAGDDVLAWAKISGSKTVTPVFKKGYKFVSGQYQHSTRSRNWVYKKNKKVNMSKVQYTYFTFKDKEGYTGLLSWGNREPVKYDN